jgi:hypothetical protein
MDDKLTIPGAADRNDKRATVIAAIATSGGVLKPVIIASRETVENELRIWGSS